MAQPSDRCKELLYVCAVRVYYDQGLSVSHLYKGVWFLNACKISRNSSFSMQTIITAETIICVFPKVIKKSFQQ